MLVVLFNETIFKPLLNLLIMIVGLIPGHNLGLSIIVLTVLVRLVLYPLSHKALRSQRQLSRLQPEIKKIQKQHKDDKQEQSKAIMAFYKENNINPFSGCVPFLIQLPVLIGLYRVFFIELVPDMPYLYGFVQFPQDINIMFLGLVNLTESSFVLALIAGLSQFALSKITFSQKKKMGASKAENGAPNFQNIMGKQMTYFFPVITVLIAQTFPAGLVLYWIATTLFSFGQQYYINKTID